MINRQWRRTLKLLVMLSIITPCLTGCWDRLEIEERAVILGIAVDIEDASVVKDEADVSHLNGSIPKPDESLLRLTAQIAVPGRIPLGPGGVGGGNAKKPVWVLSAVGHTIDDALMVLQQELADRIFLGHLRIIVVSEAYAKRGLSNLNDYLRRNQEVRRLAWMIVSDGRAEKFMNAAPELERVPALYMLAMMDHSVEMGKYPNEFIGIFWSKDSSLGREPNLPYVAIKKKQNIEISGLAYFRAGRMVGKTLPLEIGIYMGLTNEKRGGYTAFIQIPGTANSVMFRATNRKSKTKVSLKNGKPYFTIDVLLEGNIEERMNEHKSNNMAEIRRNEQLKIIQKELSEMGEKSGISLIKKTQKKGSDIFGFGEYVRAKEPTYWNQNIRTKKEWERMYKNVSFEVNYVVKIRRVGMEAK
jgi:spore germination protein KC